jgi:adenylosuccinate synthase
VLDGVETLQLGVGYRVGDQRIDILSVVAVSLKKCEPDYEEIPGWSESTVGVREFDQLPENAVRYLRRIEEICGVPIDLISTGPDREETIVLRHPFRSDG